FTSVRHHNASTASFRPALTEAPAAQPAALGTARSIPGHALAFDVEFPLSGSRSGLPPPISTSVPGTPTPRPSGLSSATTAASTPPSPVISHHHNQHQPTAKW